MSDIFKYLLTLLSLVICFCYITEELSTVNHGFLWVWVQDRPSTKVHAAPGGGSSLDYLFGGPPAAN